MTGKKLMWGDSGEGTISGSETLSCGCLYAKLSPEDYLVRIKVARSEQCENDMTKCEVPGEIVFDMFVDDGTSQSLDELVGKILKGETIEQ
jgi:hypothetical protein